MQIGGLLPDLCPLVLRHFDFQDIGRLKLICQAFNAYLQKVKIDWMPTRILDQDDRLLLIEAVNQNDWVGVKSVLRSGPVHLGFDYGHDLGSHCIITDVARRGSIELLQLLLHHGLNITDYRFLYALEACMSCKKYDMLRFMLAKHPNLADICGAQRILCQACENSLRALPEEEIRWMLETFQAARDWVNAEFYLQPIHAARDLQILKLLLEYGAVPNAQRKLDRRTKLHLIMYEVSIRIRPAMIRCLLEAGADARLTDVQGYTPMTLLLGNSPDEESLRLLQEH